MEWKAERNHSSAIFHSLGQILAALEGYSLKEIVVGSGPGSYGGVRVALAVADGLSLVHGSRVVSFSSWNGLGIRDARAWVLSDARRGGWAWGKMTAGFLEGIPEVLSAERTLDRLAECAESGIPVYSPEAAEVLDARGMKGIAPACPCAEALGRSWQSLPSGRREEFLEQPAEPLYVRAPHITSAKRPAWALKA